MKKLALAITLALCLTLLLTPVASAAGISIISKTGDGIWSGNNWQVDMYPAESKATTFALYNSSSSSLDVEVLIITSFISFGNVTFGVDDDAFTMTGKSYADVILTASASGSAAPGTYSAFVELKFEIASSGGGGGGGGGVGALEITDIEVANITETTAEITFQTNRAATSRLTFLEPWISPEIIIKDSDYTKSHTVILEDLDVCTEYQFEIYCVDKYGLRDTEDGEFTTVCFPPAPTPTPTPTPTPPTTTPPTTTPPTTTPPGEIPEAESYWGWLLWVAIGFVVIAAGALVWWFKVRRRGKA